MSRSSTFIVLLSVGLAFAANSQETTSAITYQGRLSDGSGPAEGVYDFHFTLFDATTGGNPVGTTVNVEGVALESGIFAVPLDFGASAFSDGERWLEVAVRPGDSEGGFTTLAPRQRITATPRALRSLTADSALALEGGVDDADWGFAQGSGIGADIYHSGRVGIGTAAPEQALDVAGPVRIQVGTTTVRINGDGSVVVTSQSGISFDTTGDINLTGNNVTINASGNLSVSSGQSTQITSTLDTSIRSLNTAISSDLETAISSVARTRIEGDNQTIIKGAAVLDLDGAIITLN